MGEITFGDHSKFNKNTTILIKIGAQISYKLHLYQCIR